jgi:phosphoribosylformylglycinamidine (FGAM) synthase-like amidotransferase family enzyme
VLGNLFKSRLKVTLDAFVASDKLVIGICNGFQVLVKMGILPNLSGRWDQDVSLIHNDSGKFEDRWVTCRFEEKSPCVWTKGLTRIDLPVRHGEGKFVIGSKEAEKALIDEKLASVFYVSRQGGDIGYPDNPNGSAYHIAGISDRTGRVFGLMPHPEAFIFPEQHPRWKRERIGEGSGLAIFKNAVAYFG